MKSFMEEVVANLQKSASSEEDGVLRLSARSSNMDTFLQGRPLDGDYFKSVRMLTQGEQKKAALPMDSPAGTRVAFRTNLGSVLTYSYVPSKGVLGTVVSVRTPEGDATSYDGRIMVAWDDGKFSPVLPEHLKPVSGKVANSVRMVVSDLEDLGDMFTPRKGTEDLVHKATKDLWSFRQEGDNFVLERLFDMDGSPLKV